MRYRRFSRATPQDLIHYPALIGKILPSEPTSSYEADFPPPLRHLRQVDGRIPREESHRQTVEGMAWCLSGKNRGGGDRGDQHRRCEQGAHREIPSRKWLSRESGKVPPGSIH